MKSTCHYASLLLAIPFLASGIAVPALAATPHPGPDHPGAKIYQKLCLECHGEAGEGVEGYADDPLYGNRDIESLTGRIERTMPEDEEDLCVGEDAKAVAEYIYHAFYSEEARARDTPARIDLTRLTEPQFRNSVADLILGFRGNIGFPEEHGFRANYYGGFKFNDREEYRKEKKKDRFETTDALIRFDFGEGIPKKEEAKEFDAEGFSIRWEGVLHPEETGTYEFIIRTRNGATLWVNENDHNERGDKTIDAWVAPNNEIREEKGSIFLIAGRPTPIRLEFFKYKEQKAFIELQWKPPHGVAKTIPSHNVSPGWTQESFLVSNPFPADDRSVGYERGTSVSKAWFDAVTTGALEAAQYVADHVDQLSKTKSEDPERARKIGDFGVQFTERAFRRPISEEERKRFVDRHYDNSKTVEEAVKKVVLQALTSPQFLYPGLPDGSGHDQWDIASQLALVLWDSVPDHRLRDWAAKGHLKDPKQVEQKASELVWDWRTKAKLRGFFHHWLELERAAELAKDKSVYPEFNDAVLADLRTSLDLFLEEAVWGEGGNYRQLLLADYLFLNERLGKLYGKPEIKGGFQKVAMDPNRRTGIVTHPFLLSSLAYHNSTSPIHRGVFLTRNIVGMTLKSPPMANEFKDGKFDPNLTMREKVTEMTRSKACMACHVTINPLGFSLEHFDGIGRWQTKDRDKPINATSDFKTETGETIKLTGARDVAAFAADTPSAHRAFIQQVFHHLVKQPVLAYGPDTMEQLQERFKQTGFYVPELLKHVAVTSALHQPEEPATGPALSTASVD